jgi:hypothetical protein
MSGETILTRYADRVAEERADPLVRLESEGPEDLGAFGWLRGIRERALMLELRKRDGEVLAIGYGWLERAEFNPSTGITLHIAGQQIRIAGRNLNAEVRSTVRLFEGVTRHRVQWIQESSRAASLRAPDTACVVEAIQW